MKTKGRGQDGHAQSGQRGSCKKIKYMNAIKIKY